ncbi:MAG: Dabb family protein [Bacilli bacterium]|nr:Dabb family protein [Bacilli bacterium]
MIKHIVCYKLKNRTEEAKQNVKKMFMSMPDKIEAIKEIQVGLDFLKSERSYDVVLEITFESVEKMNEYQKHPYHLNTVKPFMKEAKDLSVSVDFEF